MNTISFSVALDHLARRLPDKDAIASIRRLRDGNASEAEWIAAGEVLLRTDPAAALTVLDVAMQSLPNSASLHYLRGNALRVSGQPADAEIALRRAVTLDPVHANASISLAHLLREQGRMKGLAEVILALWQHQPRSLESDRRTLSFLLECARHEAADSLLPALLAANPEDPLLLRRAGEIALMLGRFKEARKHLHGALAVDPDQASSWLRLAHTHRFSDPGDPDLGLLRDAVARRDLAQDTRVAIGFALGKALDDLGRIAESVELFKQANVDWHARHRWDREGWHRFVDAQMQTKIVARSPVSTPTIPVFIVGLPRSGTTLAESLLARDAQIRSRGELNWIAVLARQLGPNPSVSNLAAAGNFYLAQLAQDDEPTRFHIDKNPLNFRHLGLIAGMLPQARIIHCRRDRRDTALSLWNQHFAHADMAWSYDFGDIDDYARSESALMAHWQNALSLPIFELDYDVLASEPESTIGGVRRFLGLEPQAPANDVDQVTAITTASVWQARQGVHSRSVGRSQRYLEYLPELDTIGA